MWRLGGIFPREEMLLNPMGTKKLSWDRIEVLYSTLLSQSKVIRALYNPKYTSAFLGAFPTEFFLYIGPLYVKMLRLGRIFPKEEPLMKPTLTPN